MTSHSKGGALNDFATTFEYRGKGGVKKVEYQSAFVSTLFEVFKK